MNLEVAAASMGGGISKRRSLRRQDEASPTCALAERKKGGETMSVAGVRSNRGDAYQVAIAVRETLRLLTASGADWVEIDSTLTVADGSPISVDDVVVGYADGRMVGIQCKKNQTNFVPWTAATLADELKKAGRLLKAEAKATVRFYSRADFGDLAKLAEHSRTVDSASAFENAIGQALTKPWNDLRAAWQPPEANDLETAFDFLQRTSFTFSETVALKEEIKERLSVLVTRPQDAFDILWSTLDNLGARSEDSQAAMARSSRISREQVLELLQRAGSAVAPPRAQAEISEMFRSLSAVGRQWRRDIDGKRVDRKALAELIAQVNVGAQSVLLIDGPGAGKTCVLLSLLEHLELEGRSAPVLLQTREFASATTIEEREALGLPGSLFELVSAKSEVQRVVVIIDSLDVLSLARETEALTYFLGLIDRLSTIPNVTIVAACRTFDLRYNHKLSVRKWSKTVEVGLLDWLEQVQPFLEDWGVSTAVLDDSAKLLLRNPRNLTLYSDIIRTGGTHHLVSVQGLTDAYINAVVVQEFGNDESAMEAIESMASQMLLERRLDVARVALTLDETALQKLLSAQMILRTPSGRYAFGHQTLLDALAVRGAVRRGLSLSEFVGELPEVPFVRPAIRAFFTHLLTQDRFELRTQVRAMMDSPTAFHIKRLVAESLGEMEPTLADWNLVLHLHRKHDSVFRCLYAAAVGPTWFQFWVSRAVPLWIAETQRDWLRMFVHRVSLWAKHDLTGVLTFWRRAAQSDWLEPTDLRRVIALELSRQELSDWEDTKPLVELLLSLPFVEHDFLGRALQRLVSSTEDCDDLLWRYVSEGVNASTRTSYKLTHAIRLEHSFSDKNFFPARVQASERLLSLIVEDVGRWASEPSRDGSGSAAWNDDYLDFTSHGIAHSRHSIRHRSGAHLLFESVENAVLHHAASHSDWWVLNAMGLCTNTCGALRHIGLMALARHPGLNETLATSVLSDPRLYEHTDVYELGLVIRATSSAFPALVDSIENRVFEMHSGYVKRQPDQVNSVRQKLLLGIAAHHRSRNAQHHIEYARTSLHIPDFSPEISSWSGMVAPPYSVEELVSLPTRDLVALLGFSESLGESYTRLGIGQTVGGLSQVASQVRVAATLHPALFMQTLTERWTEVSPRYRTAMLHGISMYVAHERGELQRQHASLEQVHADCDELAHELLAELERHSYFWREKLEAVGAIDSCVHVLFADDDAADRLAFAAAAFVSAGDPDECTADAQLMHVGMNSVRGATADALMTLGAKRLDAGLQLPTLLPTLLLRLADDANPAVRAMLFCRLAYFQSKSDLGWSLFERALYDREERLWPLAESCLYHSYATRSSWVVGILEVMSSASDVEALETWGRISALAALPSLEAREANRLRLIRSKSEAAWTGAVDVWVTNAMTTEHRNACFQELQHALNCEEGANVVTSQLYRLMKGADGLVPIPAAFLHVVLSKARERGKFNFYGWDTWCAALVVNNVDLALEVAEAIAENAEASYFASGVEALPELLTGLFREAEERERSDAGEMLRRVVRLQDKFHTLAPDSLTTWLRSAERV